jgi:phosphopantothenoylcysteine decarboxylase/phosphopantothenate--cysteine ligase
VDRPAGERRPFAGSTVLLGVTGGIAAFKAVTVARDLARTGATVEVVLSAGALEFIRPLSFAGLTGRRAHVEAYRPDDPLLHIRLAREADLVLVAPATANAVARAAAGMADDLLTAVLLATRAPVVFCPAMNDRMYEHPQTQANLRRLQEIGYRVVEPATGALAWGEGEGPGRLPEPGEILDHAARALQGDGPLTGRRVVVTAGPTREPIDPVRYLGNRSSGRMGYALAAAAWRRGADVLLISGPSALPAPTGVDVERVETAEQMHAAVACALHSADLLVMAAAVADFRPRAPSAAKLKKADDGVPELTLESAPDVLTETLSGRPDGVVVVGFALETGDAVAKATRKLEAKKLDLLVVNDATEEGAGFEVSTNRVTLVSPDRHDEELPLLPKEEVAERILDRVEPLLAAAPEQR